KPSTVFRIPQITFRLQELIRKNRIHKTIDLSPKSIDFQLSGVPLYSQGVRDPFDPGGSKGRYPQGYCGPTALQMVLQYYGIKKSRDYLALTNLGPGSMYVPGKGSHYPRMVHMAKHLGFKKSRMYTKRQFSQLVKSIKNGRPQIVRFSGRINYEDGTSYKPKSGHIVVVKGIQSDGKLVIHDPGRGRRVRIMNQEQFLKNWQGITVDIKT
ncbi:C39 family peptidase, partial [bacterium]|nr:C39 family peptidase [bacterium]